MELSNQYTTLPERFYARALPDTVPAPKLRLWNGPLAELLQLPSELVEDDQQLAEVFVGNERLAGSEPIALAYAGHQFGHLVPQLGDGRAHLLGELCGEDGCLYEVQLKGSGPTPFSRGGDGRCALGPALREFIMSEAMYSLQVPTTRSLAVVQTGQPVFRESSMPGAVVTRVARSHLRVGTFEYFSTRRDTEGLKALLSFAIARHDPDLVGLTGQEQVLAFLNAVMERQIELITQWMRVGFIHGVMNTDNCSISGETIDYGPCAMMGVFDPATVFSSIDRHGRYAYGNQPRMAAWNMARLAEALLPVLDEDASVAMSVVEPLVAEFASRFEASWLAMMRAKLGLVDSESMERDQNLVSRLLEGMLAKRLDYTLTFSRLAEALDVGSKGELSDTFRDDLGDDWLADWMAAIEAQRGGREEASNLMSAHNPQVIPRNHHVEAALHAAVQDNDFEPIRRFLRGHSAPYDEVPDTFLDYRDPPPDGDRGYRTFCGT